jgi:hypothetical protein
MDEKRRHPRYEFAGTALVLVENTPDGPMLILTSYRDISLGGASIVAPESPPGGEAKLEPGSEVRLLSEQQDRGREAVVVQQGPGRLHLRLKSNDEMTDFDLTRLLESLAAGKGEQEAE